VLFFFGLWVHALFSSLSFCYQYQCNWLPGIYYVSSGTLNLAQLNSTHLWCAVFHNATVSVSVLHIVTVCSVQLADKLTAVFLCPTLSTIDGKPAGQLKQSVERCRSKFLHAVCSVVVTVYHLMLHLCNCVCVHTTHITVAVLQWQSVSWLTL